MPVIVKYLCSLALIFLNVSPEIKTNRTIHNMKGKRPTLSEMTMEQLLKNEKTAKTLVIIQISMIVIMAVVGVIITMKKGFGVFTIFPVVFIGTLLPMIVSLSALRKEIRSRG